MVGNNRNVLGVVVVVVEGNNRNVVVVVEEGNNRNVVMVVVEEKMHKKMRRWSRRRENNKIVEDGMKNKNKKLRRENNEIMEEENKNGKRGK